MFNDSLLSRQITSCPQNEDESFEYTIRWQQWRLYDRAAGSRTLPRVGLNSPVQTHWLKPPQHGCRGSREVANEAEEKKKSKYSSLSPLYDFTPIAVDSWSCGRVGVGFPSGTGTPHRQLNCWATFILFPDAASQRCCAAWERRLCRPNWHCSVNQQPGQWRSFTVVFQFDCCCYRFLASSFSIFLSVSLGLIFLYL